MTKQLKITVGQHSDKGCKPINQDFHGIRIPKDSLLRTKGIAFAMADGISSSDTSHIASETAVRSFLEDYYCTADTWSVKNSAQRVLSATNSWLYTQTQQGEGRYNKDKGYVCTLSAAIIKSRTAHLFHVGDTRIYRLDHNGLEQLTNDHRIWGEDNKSHLSRALGIEGQCNFDYQSLTVKPGDLLIVCTDGIYDFVAGKEITQIIHSEKDNLNTAAKSIIANALEKGSDDNLSIQLIRIDEIEEHYGSEVQQQIDSLPFPPTLHSRMDFDGYTILRSLHSNNRSQVYLAQDNITQKKVILKIPAVDLKNNEALLEKFLMEEWAARRLNSAHVMKADLATRERNFIYTVFEFIEGQTLAQWAIDNPKASLESVRNIIEQIAKGMQALHRMEMLHQDLRPENIMIDNHGTVKIIDFGSVVIAGIVESHTEPPDTHLMGTALYSAPEYFLGEAGSIQSELFSLGVITYFLLSGRYPYDTDVPKTKTLAAQKKLWYRTITDEDRLIPAWVDDGIRKAVNPLPHRRQEEIFEFINDLRKPNKTFLNKTKPPLLERNPVAVWQGISALLFVVIIYLLNH